MKRPRCTPRQSSASRRCEAGFASSGTPSQTSHARVSASARFRVLDRPRDANSAHLKSHPPSGGETKTHSYKETNQQTAAISLRQTRRCGKNKTKQNKKAPEELRSSTGRTKQTRMHTFPLCFWCREQQHHRHHRSQRGKRRYHGCELSASRGEGEQHTRAASTPTKPCAAT